MSTSPTFQHPGRHDENYGHICHMYQARPNLTSRKQLHSFHALPPEQCTSHKPVRSATRQAQRTTDDHLPTTTSPGTSKQLRGPYRRWVWRLRHSRRNHRRRDGQRNILHLKYRRSGNIGQRGKGFSFGQRRGHQGKRGSAPFRRRSGTALGGPSSLGRRRRLSLLHGNPLELFHTVLVAARDGKLFVQVRSIGHLLSERLHGKIGGILWRKARA